GRGQQQTRSIFSLQWGASVLWLVHPHLAAPLRWGCGCANRDINTTAGAPMSTPTGRVQTRKGRRKGSSTLESLVLDARAGLTPAQMVERKLTALLGYSPLAGRLSTAPGESGAWPGRGA